MTFTRSIASKVLFDGREYFYVTLNGEIPSSATRYSTRAGAVKAIARLAA